MGEDDPVACVLAQLPKPWSELRGHFESLLFGPVDWTSAAAIVALAEKTRRDSEAARDGLELLSEVWQVPYGGADKTVDVHLSWLRRKLGETAQAPRYLHTLRGVGVRLSEPA